MELKQTTISFTKLQCFKFVTRKLQVVATYCVGLCYLYGCGFALNLITISLILNARYELTSNVVLLQPKSKALHDEKQEH
jgi:hypothetical protein